MCLGTAMNILAITVNHGQMPVLVPVQMGPFAPGMTMDAIHVTWSESVRFWFLCDWIYVRWIGVVSPGDCVLWLGEWLSPYIIGAAMALLWFKNDN